MGMPFSFASSSHSGLLRFSRLSRLARHRRPSFRTHTSMAWPGQSAVRSEFKLALCQIGVTSSKTKNLSFAAAYLRQAAANGAKMAVLPECFNSPYDTSCFPEYAEALPEVGHHFAAPTSSPSLQMLRETARETGMVIVGGSVPEMSDDKRVFNTSLTVDASGNVIAKHRKVHLFDVNVPGGIQFRESDALAAGSCTTAFAVRGLCDMDVVFGVGICYDLRFPEMAMLAAREAGAHVLIFPGAFNMTTGPAHWELLLRARALDNQVYVAACSPARDPVGDGYIAWGHSSIVDPWGTVVATTDEKPSVVYANIDLLKVAHVRAAIPTGSQRREDLYQLKSVKTEKVG